MDSEPRLVSSAQCPAPSLQPAGWEAAGADVSPLVALSGWDSGRERR